jgi:hypothetical protein
VGNKPPTRTESILGLVMIAGALVLVGRCVSGGSKATEPTCQTELDCKLAANTKRQAESCGRFESGKRHVQDREYDLARGIRTGSMSAEDVRSASETLEATRQYTQQAEADCKAANAEAAVLVDQASAVYHASQAAPATPSSPPAVPKPKRPAQAKKGTAPQFIRDRVAAQAARPDGQ